jgi:hypothetical protein
MVYIYGVIHYLDYERVNLLKNSIEFNKSFKN